MVSVTISHEDEAFRQISNYSGTKLPPMQFFSFYTSVQSDNFLIIFELLLNCIIWTFMCTHIFRFLFLITATPFAHFFRFACLRHKVWTLPFDFNPSLISFMSHSLQPFHIVICILTLLHSHTCEFYSDHFLLSFFCAVYFIFNSFFVLFPRAFYFNRLKNSCSVCVNPSALWFI